jgi:glycogenin glucosyltransferase
MPNAWITLATNDGYAVGALVLAHSLKRVETKHDLHILYTEGVTSTLRYLFLFNVLIFTSYLFRNQLHEVFTHATLVNVLDSNDQENLTLIGRPDLGLTFTKLHAWRLTQYEKAVFLDADTLVVQNADELFDRPDFSAAPDIGMPFIIQSELITTFYSRMA